MVGWLHWSGENGWRPRLTVARVMELPVLAAALPNGREERRLAQGAKALRRRGVRRVLLPAGTDGDDLLSRFGLQKVEALPLYRRLAAKLALTLLEQVPVRKRCIALRGERADRLSWQLADELCVQAGILLLEFGQGEEALAAHLRSACGIAPIHLGQGPEPQVSIELAPCSTAAGRPLQLWGELELQGLELAVEGALPPGMDGAALLELLWEMGRLQPEQILIRRAGQDEMA